MNSFNLKNNQNDNLRPNNEILKQLQDSFCRANKVYGRCLARDLTPITSAFGRGDEQEYLMKVTGGFTASKISAMVEDTSMESVVECDTGYDHIRLAAVVIRQNKNITAFWIITGILKDKISDEIREDMPEGMMMTTEEDFFSSLELLEVISKEYFEAKKYESNVLETVRSDENRMDELKKELKLHVAMNKILKSNEADDSFAEVATEILKEGAEYLDVPFISVLQKVRGTNHISELVHYWKNGINPIKSMPENFCIEDCPYFTGKTYIFSSDAILPDAFEKHFREYDISAAMFLPIEVSGNVGLYITVIVPRVGRIFSISDIKFANDMKKVLQNVLARKVKQNSLAGSFGALESVINNMDLAIHVSDPTTHRILFTNKAYKKLDIIEGIQGGIEEYLASEDVNKASGKYEYFDTPSGRWFEIGHAKITWVDGRGAILSTLYEITDKKNYVQKIEYDANNDFITGLYNRMHFESDLRDYIKKAEDLNTNGAIIYLDLDNYKAVKEGLGRKNGDDLLKEVSKSLQKIEGLEGFCYAMGTDQFSIIINHRSYPYLSNILLKIKNLFDDPWMVGGKQYYCYMNMGVAIYPTDGNNAEELMRKADIALFEAKRHGRNSYEYYIEQMGRGNLHRKKMEKSIMDAATNDFAEFGVYYQPIFNEDGETEGAEALVRWNSRELGFVPPDEFIPILEYMRLMSPIGDIVLQTALAECRKWMEAGRPELKVHVNLSVTQLMEEDIAERISEALNEAHVSPSNLVIEVTEKLAVNDLDRMRSVLAKIKRLGVLVALDDFGVGFSSINYVKEMPIDMLKIDRSLIFGIDGDEFKQSFLKSAKDMAKTLGFVVCAEGVESDKEAEIVRKCGISLIQGYIYEKPLTSIQFVKKYI
ncbi:MAG: bifunctional diguanylate cyclase/phosphodiesterase [Lachnospiraceae bacterium]|nr:bifunctional diguanylate cyclase/phosphodiesterase [Lachnospiraceae bacterium]